MRRIALRLQLVLIDLEIELVMCFKHSNGKRASPANLKSTIGSIGCHSLVDRGYVR